MTIQETFGIRLEVDGQACILSIPMLSLLKKWVRAYSKIDPTAAQKYTSAEALYFWSGLHNYELCEFYRLPVCYVDGNLAEPMITDIDDDDRDYSIYPQLVAEKGHALPDGEFTCSIQSCPDKARSFLVSEQIRCRTVNGVTIALDPVFRGRPGNVLRSLQH